jgi:hypothetical protein
LRISPFQNFSRSLTLHTNKWTGVRCFFPIALKR